MRYRDVACDRALKAITRPDVLFQGRYTVDPYQWCALGCRYCDSARDTVDVHVNVADVLASELPSVAKGRVILGSVHDPYQPVEERTGLSRAVLSTLRDQGFSCHILTKSPLVLRDLPLIASFDCRVTVSILSVDPALAEAFEPSVASPRVRLDLLRTLRASGVTAGVALIPFLPMLAETSLEATVAAAADASASYLVFKHLELKGEQRDRFMEALSSKYTDVVSQYQRWYGDAMAPDEEYLRQLRRKISEACRQYGVPCGMAEAGLE